MTQAQRSALAASRRRALAVFFASLAGHQALGLEAHQLAQRRCSGALGHRIHSGLHQRFEMRDRPGQSQIGGGTGSAVVQVLAHGLAQGLGLADHVADVIGHLVSLAQAFAQGAPGLWIGAS